MSQNYLLNDSTPLLNSTQLGLPLFRETFVAPDTVVRADLYAIRGVAERSLELQERSMEALTPEVIGPDYTGQHEQMLSTMDDVRSSIYDIVAANESGFADLSGSLSDVRDGISDMTGVIHGDLQLLQ